MLQVDLLLTCTHIISVPVESILKLPEIDTEIKCAICQEKARVLKLGNPYHVEIKEENKDSSQLSMLEE